MHQGKLVALDTPTAAAGGGRRRRDHDSHRRNPSSSRPTSASSSPATAKVVDGSVRLEQPDGHQWMPRLVEAFPDRIDAITLGKPTLEDVFIHTTGHRFWNGEPASDRNEEKTADDDLRYDCHATTIATVPAWPVVFTLAQRELVRFFRQRNRVFGALGQPIIFWLLFSAGLGSTKFGDSNRLDYAHFFPGTLVMILLFTAIFATISIIEDRREGFLQGVLVAPVPRWSMVLGKVLGGAAIAMLQGLLFLVLGWLHARARFIRRSFGLVGVGRADVRDLDRAHGAGLRHRLADGFDARFPRRDERFSAADVAALGSVFSHERGRLAGVDRRGQPADLRRGRAAALSTIS